MTILVLGASGQLATHLRELLPDAAYCGRNTLDLADPTRVEAAIEAHRPSAIVNAAGYTAVDKAESEPALAWRVNAESVAAVARAATALEVPFVQVSTDYIFDGRKAREYQEDDVANPLSVYGATKLAGELASRTLCKKSWILRTSCVFSEHGDNFLSRVLHLATLREELGVVADQHRRPTYAGSLAAVIAELVRRRDARSPVPFGTYHAVGGPIASPYEFAELIVEAAFERGVIAKRIPVRPLSTAEHPTTARRPANSALRPSSELQRTLGIAMDWREGLTRALTRLCE